MIAILSASLSHSLAFCPSAFTQHRQIICGCFILSDFVSCNVFDELVLRFKPTSSFVSAIHILYSDIKSTMRKFILVSAVSNNILRALLGRASFFCCGVCQFTPILIRLRDCDRGFLLLLGHRRRRNFFRHNQLLTCRI